MSTTYYLGEAVSFVSSSDEGRPGKVKTGRIVCKEIGFPGNPLLTIEVFEPTWKPGEYRNLPIIPTYYKRLQSFVRSWDSDWPEQPKDAPSAFQELREQQTITVGDFVKLGGPGGAAGPCPATGTGGNGGGVIEVHETTPPADSDFDSVWVCLFAAGEQKLFGSYSDAIKYLKSYEGTQLLRILGPARPVLFKARLPHL